jgi:hypothetical protein
MLIEDISTGNSFIWTGNKELPVFDKPGVESSKNKLRKIGHLAPGDQFLLLEPPRLSLSYSTAMDFYDFKIVGNNKILFGWVGFNFHALSLLKRLDHEQ